MVGSKLAVVCAALVSVGARTDVHAPCQVLTEVGNPECYKNVMWAKTSGIISDPEYYSNIPFLNVNSSLEDFQYALASGEEDGEGRRWNCTRPCVLSAAAQEHLAKLPKSTEGSALASSTESHEKLPSEVSTAARAKTAMSPTAAPTAAPAKTAMSPHTQVYSVGSSAEGVTTTATPDRKISWIWWVLIVLGLCCLLPLLGLACSAFMCYESVAWIFGGSGKRSPQKKKKRAVVPTQPAPASMSPPAEMPSQQPVQSYTVPLPTYQPVTTYMTATPQTVVAAPTVYTAPPVLAPTQYVTTTAPGAVYMNPPVAGQF